MERIAYIGIDVHKDTMCFVNKNSSKWGFSGYNKQLLQQPFQNRKSRKVLKKTKRLLSEVEKLQTLHEIDYKIIPLFYSSESVIFVAILQIRGVYAFRNEI